MECIYYFLVESLYILGLKKGGKGVLEMKRSVFYIVSCCWDRRYYFGMS